MIPQTARKDLNKKLGQLDNFRHLVKENKRKLDQTKEKAENIKEAQEIAQYTAQVIQQKAHDKIARVVSQCLSAIFDEPYNFVINFERKRGRTEAKLVFERGGVEVDPMSASGGGVVDVASFALRLSCLILNQPSLRRLLIMDEPFKYVSEEYRERVKILLETLAEEMKVQFVMVTHIEELKTGKVVQL